MRGKISKKKCILGLTGAVSFLLFLILAFLAHGLAGRELSQTMAGRWSREGDASQISVFFSVNSGMTEDGILEFEHTIDNSLKDASVQQESENPGARLWADAYSAPGAVTISTGKTSIQATALGVGGDFFLFHPLPLVSGSYFSGSDLMQDHCIIDRDAAWQLFGSSDVAGMYVNIGGVPHMVTGVTERPKGRLEEGAGLTSTLVYVSYQTLEELGQSNGLNHYEIVMPNPVTGFAEKIVREGLAGDGKETEVIENTTRFDLIHRLKRLGQFGLRSMNGKAILYPYWENLARGYEDILSVVTLSELLFLAYALILALVLFVLWWRHKGWTLREKWRLVRDKLERLKERHWERQRQRKEKRREQPRQGFLAGREKRSGKPRAEKGLFGKDRQETALKAR